MIISEHQNTTLIDLIKKDQKENKYNKDMQVLLEELKSVKFNNKQIMTKDEVDYIVDITKVFEKTGLLTKGNKIYKSQLDTFCIRVGDLFLEMAMEI